MKAGVVFNELRARVEKFVSPLALCFCFLIIIFAAFAPFISPDLYWHLRIGTDFLFHGLNPLFDHYSFTFVGAHQHQLTLPFDMLVSVLFKYLGYWGIDFYRLCVWSIDLLLFNALISKEKAGVNLRCFALSLFVYSIVSRAEPRPELLSVPLELIFLMIMPRWQERRSWGMTCGICAILLVWVNMHVSSAFGFLIAGAYVLETLFFAFKNSDRRDLQFAVVSGLLMFSIGFANPDFFHPLFLPFTFDPRWRLYIDEFLPVSYNKLEMPLQIFFAMALISLPGLYLQKKYAAIFLVLALAIENLKTEKIILHSIPIATPFLIMGYDFYIKKLAQAFEKRAAMISQIALIIVMISVFGYSFSVVAVPLNKIKSPEVNAYFPSDVVAYMKKKGMKGRILADYGLGGYLIFEMYPETQIYIDGRTNMVYPYDFFEKYWSISRNPKYLADEAEKYKIDYVVTSFDNLPTSESVRISKLFTLDYVGRRNSLYVRNGGRFKYFMSQLLVPDCVSSTPDSRLFEEEKIIETALPTDSALRHFANLIGVYQNTQDKRSLFHEYVNFGGNLPMNRLAANFAKREKIWPAVQFYLEAIKEKQRTLADRLDLAESYCRIDDCARAEHELELASHWPLLDVEWVRFASLLKEVKSKTSLKLFSDKTYDTVQKYVETHPVKEGSLSTLCE
jgi:hypothetical protein